MSHRTVAPYACLLKRTMMRRRTACSIRFLSTRTHPSENRGEDPRQTISNALSALFSQPKTLKSYRQQRNCRQFSSESSSDPSALQFDFNRLISSLGAEAFRFSFEELQDALEQLQCKFRLMEENEIPIQTYEETLLTVQKLMSTSAKLGTLNGAELTERYLMLVLKSHARGQDQTSVKNYHELPVLGPTKEMYTLAIDAWAKMDKRTGGSLMPSQRAHEILQFMWEEYNADSAYAVKPDIIHYTAVLQSLAKASSRKATQTAISLLKNAELKSGLRDFLKSNGKLMDVDANLMPDRTCYNSVLYCLARYFHSRDDVQRRNFNPNSVMAQIMETMESIAKKLHDDSWMPNTRTYNLLLMACNTRGNGGGIEAEKILKQMLERSDRFVDEDLGIVFPKDRDIDEVEENSVLPNIKSYNNVINAWSHDGSEYGPKRAEEILRALLQSSSLSSQNCEHSGDITSHPVLSIIDPDVVTFNLTINSWAKSGLQEAGERAEAILDFMNGKQSKSIFTSGIVLNMNDLHVEPDVISFNSVMNAWSKSGGKEGAERAEGILFQLLSLNGKDGIMPNSISFSTVIHAWSKSSDPECGSKAEAIFDRLVDLYVENDEEALRPSESCFEGLVSAWCNEAIVSGREEAFNKARKLLVRMQSEGGFPPKLAQLNLLLSVPSKMQGITLESRFDLAMKARDVLIEFVDTGRSPNLDPDIYSFNNVLRGFLGIGERESLFAALDTFNALCQSNSCNPNYQTYIVILRIVQECLVEDTNDRARLCEEIFRKCCESGLLTNAVIRIVVNMLPSDSLRRLEGCKTNIEPGGLTVYNLPSEWSENRRVGQNERRNRSRGERNRR